MPVKNQKRKQNLHANLSFPIDVWHLETATVPSSAGQVYTVKWQNQSPLKGSPAERKPQVTWGPFLPLQTRCSLSALAGAGRDWPFVRRPHRSFEWHSWPSGWNSSLSFEAAPLWSRTSSVGWSLSAARVSYRGARKDSSVGLQCHVQRGYQNAAFPICWSWGRLPRSSCGEAKHCSWCDLNTGLWERSRALGRQRGAQPTSTSRKCSCHRRERS